MRDKHVYGWENSILSRHDIEGHKSFPFDLQFMQFQFRNKTFFKNVQGHPKMFMPEKRQEQLRQS